MKKKTTEKLHMGPKIWHLTGFRQPPPERADNLTDNQVVGGGYRPDNHGLSDRLPEVIGPTTPQIGGLSVQLFSKIQYHGVGECNDPAIEQQKIRATYAPCSVETLQFE